LFLLPVESAIPSETGVAISKQFSRNRAAPDMRLESRLTAYLQAIAFFNARESVVKPFNANNKKPRRASCRYIANTTDGVAKNKIAMTKILAIDFSEPLGIHFPLVTVCLTAS
jgi:hypothetical protein